MNLSNFSKVAGVLITLLLVSSCASQSIVSEYQTPQKKHRLNDISHLGDRERADLYEAIIAADLAAANLDFETATSYYLSAARISSSTDLIQLTLDAAKNSNDNLAMLQAAEMWLESEPKNTEALVIKIQALLSHQDVDQAVTSTKRLFEVQTNKEQLAFLLDDITLEKTPPVTNAYFTQLNAEYPEHVAVSYARGAFFARVAKLTPKPAEIMRQAFSQLNNALQLQGDFIPAIDHMTRLFYQARKDEKAEAFLRKLHGDFPKSDEISHLLGQLLYDLRKFDLAKEHYTNWLKTHKKDKKAHFFLASSYFASSDFKNSLAEFQQILGSDYKPQITYFFCGNSATQVKQYAQAIACYNLVSEGKYLTRSKVELAKVYALTGEIDKALATVRDPKNAETEAAKIQLINIEVELLNQHVDSELAKQRLASAMLNHPNNVSLLFKKIRIEKLIEQPENLLPMLKQARTSYTDETQRHQLDLSIAALLRNNNHYQQAVDWLSEALKDKPQDRDFLYARALYKEPLGLFDEMIKDFKLLLAIDPENVNIKNALGYTLADVNQDLDLASELIEQAYLAMPNNAAVIDSKGWLAFRKGAYREALQFLNMAFKMAPSADVATHIGEVYWQTGDKSQAMHFLQKAKSLDSKNYLLLTTVKRLGIKLP